ncbi:MAG: hypothetical protein QXP99_03045 [Thermoproteota archaeon]
MDFFKDYSNISSEEILDKILGEEIKYSISWWGEEGLLHSGTVMDFYDRERYWTKASDFEIDRELIRFDSKRVILEEVETVIDAKMGIAILNRLARISRGVFQPTNVSSRWLTPEGPKWQIQEVSFDFKGKRHSIDIALKYDYIEDMGLEELNDLIEDTGYRYCQVEGERITVVVLSREEFKKLERERGWKFEWGSIPWGWLRDYPFPSPLATAHTLLLSLYSSSQSKRKQPCNH